MKNYLARQKEISQYFTYSPVITKTHKNLIKILNNTSEMTNSKNNYEDNRYTSNFLDKKNLDELNGYNNYDYSNINEYIAKKGKKKNCLVNDDLHTHNKKLMKSHEPYNKKQPNFRTNFSRSRSKSKSRKIINNSKVKIDKDESLLKSQNLNNQRYFSDDRINLKDNYTINSNLDCYSSKKLNLQHEDFLSKQERQHYNTHSKDSLEKNYYSNNIAESLNQTANEAFNKYHNYKNLYSEAEKIKLRKMILSQEVYSEKNGITFKPKINENSKYKVNLSFFERGINYAKRKKENYEKLIRDKSERELQNLRRSRSLSKSEMEKHTKIIVERLYKKEMDKKKEKTEKMLEEQKKLLLETKKNQLKKQEIEQTNKTVVQRLYSNEIQKIKEKFNSKDKELKDKELEEIENHNLSKIKEMNNKLYANIKCRVNTNIDKAREAASLDKKNNKNKNNTRFSSNKMFEDELYENNLKLLQQLRQEHKIKFKNNQASSKKDTSKSKGKNLHLTDNGNSNHEHFEKKSFELDNNKYAERLNTENQYQPYDISSRTNNNANSLFGTNHINKSKIVSPLKAKQSINYPLISSEFILENPTYKLVTHKKSEKKNDLLNSGNSVDKQSKAFIKKTSLSRDVNNHNGNLSPIKNKASLTSDKNETPKKDNALPFQNFSNKNLSNIDNNKAFTKDIQTRSENMNKYNLNFPTHDYSSTDNQNSNANPGEQKSGTLTDNSDHNSKSFEIKENKFKSKGLEKILSNRK